MVAVSIIVRMLSKDFIQIQPADKSMQGLSSKMAYVLQSDMPEHRKNKTLLQVLRAFAPPEPPRTRNEQKQGQDRFKHFQQWYLVDQQGMEMNGYRIPEPVSVLLSRDSEELLVANQNDYFFIGPTKVVLNGKKYDLFITQYIGRFKARILFHLFHSITIWQWLSYLLVSVLVCLGLAFSITRPIKKLKNVMQAVANGEAHKAEHELGTRFDEFGDLARSFDEMSEKIHASIDSQKQLLSDVSHELRSPLTRLQVALGVLEKTSGNQAMIERIELECNRMDEMIGQLLSMAAIERGQTYESKQLIDLKQLLESVINDAQFEAQKKQVTIKAEFETDRQVNGYYGLLRSAIENVVRNAIRYSEQGGEIKLSLICGNEQCRITIADYGVGVKQEHLTTIFEPFYRTEKARSRESGGAGLGLTIAAKAIAAHSGLIRAYPNEPKGLVVEILVPFRSA